MEENTNTGLIESRSRVLEELLAKTTFKDSLRLFLKSIDPESSPHLVRTMLGTDIEVPLAVAGALPVLANCFIKAGHELIVQVREKFPPPLLASFVESLLDEIDKETLANLIVEAKELKNDLAPLFFAVWKVIQDQAARKEEDYNA
ncbi:MAG: hypothetical protein ACLQDF_11280 [Desulfomonilia bacterium]